MRWIEWLTRSGPRVRAVPTGLGRWGMYTYLEPHVRRLAAEHLRVASERLVCRASLRDDLSADPRTLRGLAVALEAEFAVVLPVGVADDVRSYADLVHAIGALVQRRRAA
jgi:hypothetical protein